MLTADNAQSQNVILTANLWWSYKDNDVGRLFSEKKSIHIMYRIVSTMNDDESQRIKDTSC